MIGLIGAHRVGKSSLATYTSAKMNLPFIPVSIGQMQQEIGFDSSRMDYTFEDRIVIQEHLLNSFRVKLVNAQRGGQGITRDIKSAVFDRTPLDLIGYTLIHANDELTEEQSQWLLDYIERCIHLTNEYFTHIMLVQPGIPLVTDNTTSAKASAGIIEHLNAIYMAYLLDPRVKVNKAILPRDILDMQDRFNYLSLELMK